MIKLGRSDLFKRQVLLPARADISKAHDSRVQREMFKPKERLYRSVCNLDVTSKTRVPVSHIELNSMKSQ